MSKIFQIQLALSVLKLFLTLSSSKFRANLGESDAHCSGGFGRGNDVANSLPATLNSPMKLFHVHRSTINCFI
jgi:hypothetical protein